MTSSRDDKTGVGAARSAGESSRAVPNGTVIGVYRVDGVLGQGGMGIVYRAMDTKLRRPVAIKFLSAALGDPQARRRFQQEAETASSLNHPHIVTVHDVGEHEGGQYIVSELVEGGTLEDWLTSHPQRTSRQTVELLIGVADAIAAAHAAGVLHRDIKPGNILIDANGYAKLADFGLAKLLAPSMHDGASGAALGTVAGVVVGTVAYMSPEQATGQPLDARSDVFSFGVVLYEALAGRRPFEAGNDLELLKTIVHGAPPPLPNDVPEQLRNAVERALEKDPADRYQSMRDLVSDLRRLARRGSQRDAEHRPEPAQAREDKLVDRGGGRDRVVGRRRLVLAPPRAPARRCRGERGASPTRGPATFDRGFAVRESELRPGAGLLFRRAQRGAHQSARPHRRPPGHGARVGLRVQGPS
jgi:serine/threonine protein kinase